MAPSEPPRQDPHTQRITARIQKRYPAAPAALVDTCVDEAFDHYGDARVRVYLPVLVERRATRSVARALQDPDARPSTEP